MVTEHQIPYIYNILLSSELGRNLTLIGATSQSTQVQVLTPSHGKGVPNDPVIHRARSPIRTPTTAIWVFAL